MSEMAQTAEQVIVIGRGRLIADTTMAAFIRSASSGRVRVRTPRAERLAELLARTRWTSRAGGGVLEVRGTSSEQSARSRPPQASCCTS